MDDGAAPTQDRPTRQLVRRIAKVVVGVALLVGFVSVLLPSQGKPREQAQRVKCASNLRQIGQLLILYARDNGGVLPGTIYDTAGADSAGYAYACANRLDGYPYQASVRDQMAWAARRETYLYAAASQRVADLPPDAVLVFEAVGMHPADRLRFSGEPLPAGGNVLWVDGSAEFVSDDVLRALAAAHARGERPLRLPK
jgi:prepilin-type processing-associated H-X9-DG protein